MLNEIGKHLESASSTVGKMECTLREANKPTDKLAKAKLLWDELSRQHSNLVDDHRELVDANKIRVRYYKAIMDGANRQLGCRTHCGASSILRWRLCRNCWRPLAAISCSRA